MRGSPSIGGIVTKIDGDGDMLDPADLCINKVTAMVSTITCRANPISQYSHINDKKKKNELNESNKGVKKQRL